MNRCPKCGLNIDLVGVRHNCDPARLNQGLKISTKKSTEPVGDGIALTSMAHPPGLIERLAKEIQPGGGICLCPCCQRWRAKKALQMKRYRTKKKVQTHGGKSGP